MAQRLLCLQTCQASAIDYLARAHIGRRLANAPLTNGIALIWLLANGSEADKDAWEGCDQKLLTRLSGNSLVRRSEQQLRGLATVVASVRFMQKPRGPIDSQRLQVVEFVSRADVRWTLRELQRRLKAVGLHVDEKTLRRICKSVGFKPAPGLRFGHHGRNNSGHGAGGSDCPMWSELRIDNR